MNDLYLEGEEFTAARLKAKGWQKADYENCTFKTCDLANIDLSRSSFVDCEFLDCNLSNAKILETSFQDCYFKNCKMLGLRFDSCNTFSLSMQFQNCNLSESVFFGLDLQKSNFNACELGHCDFGDAKLNNISLKDSNLKGCIWGNTHLDKANLQGVQNLELNPQENHIQGIKLQAESLIGLLREFQIELC